MKIQKDELSRRLFVWRDATLYSSMTDYLIQKHTDFIDGRPTDSWHHPIKFKSPECVSCRKGEYKRVSEGSLVPKRFLHYRKQNYANLGAAHGNVVIEEEKSFVCPICGFAYHVEKSSSGHMNQTDWFDLTVAALLNFNLNDPELAMAEIGAHCTKHPEELIQLDPWKYEELVEDVFKNLGYRVVRTQATRDGGYDLRLYGDNDDQVILVECKRWKDKVSVDVVRQLTGVMYSLGENKGMIVGASAFTRDAETFAAGVKTRHPEYDMRLVELQGFLKELALYNDELPPLQELAKMGDEAALSLISEYEGCLD